MTTIETSQPRTWTERLNIRRFPALLAVLLTLFLLAVNAAVQPNFFSIYIIESNITTFLPLMIIAVGQAYVVLGGSIDLSLGSIVSLVNVVVVVVAEALGGGGNALPVAMVCGIGAGLICGLINGILIGVFRLQAVVTSFATSIVISGVALIVLPQAGGALPPVYYLTYASRFLGIPVVAWFLLALLVFVWWFSGTRTYAYLMATGGNKQAAFQTGLSIQRSRLLSHTMAGGFSALAALCILGVAGAGDPLMGQAFTLASVSAVVLGGMSLAGGWGGAGGAMLGAAILGLINNLIFFSNINYVYQSVVQGTMVLLALAGGVFLSRRPH